MTLTVLFLAASSLFLLMSALTLFHLHWAVRLPALAELATVIRRHDTTSSQIDCSVVIAARDEGSRIEGSIRRLLVQSDVQVEVIVVDDRSTDRTGEVLARLCDEDERVRALRVDEVPAGWLGKCNACHLGVAVARGEWILFTDADCWLTSDVISRALRVAARDGVDHITLTPGIGVEARGARAWHLAFLVTLANWFSGVNRDRADAHLGMGAFNLVRRTAYRECGGYEALRMTVLDDVRLGLLLRRAGKRTRAFIGGSDVVCDWGVSIRSMFKIMEKNYFAATDFRTVVTLAASLGGLALWAIALLGPLTGTWAGWVAGICLFTLIVPGFVLARRLNWRLTDAVLMPLMFPVMFGALLNSMWVTIRQGGIWWRGTFYPLAALRAGAITSRQPHV